MIQARDLVVRYGETRAINGVSLTIDRGECLAITGASGSGKSTLLHCLAGLRVPDEGTVRLDGQDLGRLSDTERSAARLRTVGLVFQLGLLVPELSLEENVALPLVAAGIKHRAAMRAARDELTQLGVADVARRRPSDVSGGQMQRAAIARAVVHKPAVVFADEPTGALDRTNGMAALRVLLGAARSAKAAVVVVTHEEFVASACDRVLTMVDGSLR